MGTKHSNIMSSKVGCMHACPAIWKYFRLGGRMCQPRVSLLTEVGVGGYRWISRAV
jgi:hypothetical protein